MPMRLEGSCRCGAISFSVDSHTPYPYERCYCSICRKSTGGGGYAINIMGLADTLRVKGKRALGVWNAPIEGHKGSADRHYCKRCGTPLWVSDEQWPELVHPFASAIDTELPKAPSTVHLLLRDKASWVEPLSSDGVPFAALAKREGVSPSYFTRLVRLSYLAPDITQAILDGRQPRDLTGDKLLAHSRLPLAWHQQRTVLGFT
jgi:hypothetical protein